MEFPGNVAENVTYTYDDPTVGNHGIGRLARVDDDSGSTSWVYDARGNVVQETRVIGAQAYVTGYGYDLADRLVQMTYPSGRIVDYVRDALGRVTSVTTRENAGAPDVTLASAGTYEPFGGLNGLTYGNGATLALGYDLDGRITAIDTFNGTTPVLDLDYDQYDLAGNIRNITDLGGGDSGRTYGYDELYRLTSAQLIAPGGGVAEQIDYDYDPVGNRLSRDVDSVLETYDYDVFSNQLDSVTEGGEIRNLGYSASGNTASDDRGAAPDRTLVYDSTDRLVQVDEGATTLASYVHNAMGQRVAKTVGGATTHFLYDLSGRVVAEADGTTGVVTSEYVWLESMPLAFIQGGAVYSIHADHLGTPQRLTDGSGVVVWDASYRPFGETTVNGSVTFNLRFPGQYLDAEAGLHYNYFRDYDPAVGRYIESDSIGLDAGWNTYAYAGGNPVIGTDRNGLRIMWGSYIIANRLVRQNLRDLDSRLKELLGSCDVVIRVTGGDRFVGQDGKHYSRTNGMHIPNSSSTSPHLEERGARAVDFSTDKTVSQSTVELVAAGETAFRIVGDYADGHLHAELPNVKSNYLDPSYYPGRTYPQDITGRTQSIYRDW